MPIIDGAGACCPLSSAAVSTGMPIIDSAGHVAPLFAALRARKAVRLSRLASGHSAKLSGHHDALMPMQRRLAGSFRMDLMVSSSQRQTCKTRARQTLEQHRKRLAVVPWYAVEPPSVQTALGRPAWTSAWDRHASGLAKCPAFTPQHETKCTMMPAAGTTRTEEEALVCHPWRRYSGQQPLQTSGGPCRPSASCWPTWGHRAL